MNVELQIKSNILKALMPYSYKLFVDSSKSSMLFRPNTHFVELLYGWKPTM